MSRTVPRRFLQGLQHMSLRIVGLTQPMQSLCQSQVDTRRIIGFKLSDSPQRRRNGCRLVEILSRRCRCVVHSAE